MGTHNIVSSTLRGAGRELRRAFTTPLEQLRKPEFIRAWCAVAYMFPGLHPEGYDDRESGRPRALRRLQIAVDYGERADG
jgi:hypothetical protein